MSSMQETLLLNTQEKKQVMILKLILYLFCRCIGKILRHRFALSCISKRWQPPRLFNGTKQTVMGFWFVRLPSLFDVRRNHQGCHLPPRRITTTARVRFPLIERNEKHSTLCKGC